MRIACLGFTEGNNASPIARRRARSRLQRSHLCAARERGAAAVRLELLGVRPGLRRTFNGASGHLATVSSAAENSFLFTLAGQPFSFVNWGGSEPNNAGFAYMNIGTAVSRESGPGSGPTSARPRCRARTTTRSSATSSSTRGAAMVPEPATWLLRRNSYL